MRKAPVAFALMLACLGAASFLLWQRLQPAPVVPPPLVIAPEARPEPTGLQPAPKVGKPVRWPSEEWYTEWGRPYFPQTSAEKEAARLIYEGKRFTPTGRVLE
jgi:hypothetical protein